MMFNIGAWDEIVGALDEIGKIKSSIKSLYFTDINYVRCGTDRPDIRTEFFTGHIGIKVFGNIIKWQWHSFLWNK